MLEIILRSLLFELNIARSSANSRRRTLHSLNVTSLLEELSLSILSMYRMNRRGERTQPCRSLTLRLKGFVFMPLTRTQTSDGLCKNWIAADTLAVLPTTCLLEHGHLLFLRSTKYVYTSLTYSHDFSKTC